MRARTCSRPGCYGFIKDDVCTQCGRAYRRWGSRSRATAAQRGYDAAWRKVRGEYIRERVMAAVEAGISPYPICEICQKPIVGEIHVDHKIPFNGMDDPHRLDINNLRVAHRACHMRTTGASGMHKD